MNPGSSRGTNPGRSLLEQPLAEFKIDIRMSPSGISIKIMKIFSEKSLPELTGALAAYMKKFLSKHLKKSWCHHGCKKWWLQRGTFH